MYTYYRLYDQSPSAFSQIKIGVQSCFSLTQGMKKTVSIDTDHIGSITIANTPNGKSETKLRIHPAITSRLKRLLARLKPSLML